MSQASELLNNLVAGDEYTQATSTAAEDHIVVGFDRYITVPMSLRRIAVQYDHNVETVTFDCPRYWDGNDLSTMAIYINYVAPGGIMDSYPAKNTTVDAADKTIMHFDWTISNNVTKEKGSIAFLICAKTVDEEGNEELHWNSERNTEMYVSEGLETTERPENTYPDIITELLLRMTSVEAVRGDAETYAETAAIFADTAGIHADDAAASAEEARAYTETSKQIAADSVNINARIDRNDKRLSILEQGLVNYIPSETDADISYVKNVPENALPYASINEIGGITRKCRNLIKFPYSNSSGSKNGVDISIGDDGCITFNGTTTANVYFNIGTVKLRAGTYTLSGQDARYDTNNTRAMYVLVNESYYWRNTSFTIDADTNVSVGIKIDSGLTLDNLMFYPMLNGGGTAFPHELYFEGLRDAKVTAVESVGRSLVSAADVYGSWADKVTKDGRTCYRFKTNVDHLSAPVAFKENTQYTVRFDVLISRIEGSAPNDWAFVFKYTDGSRDVVGIGVFDQWRTMSKTSAAGKSIESVGVTVNQYQIWNYIDVDTFIFVEGTEIPENCKPYFKNIFAVPEEVQALEGYGQGINASYCNKIVLDPANGVKKYVQTVSKVNLGTKAYTRLDSKRVYYAMSALGIKKGTTVGVSNIKFTANYDTLTNYNGEIIGAMSEGTLYVKNPEFANMTDEEIKAYLDGIWLVYERSSWNETDVSTYFTDDNLIKVEGGGTITAENEYGHDAPTDITYWLKKTTT